MKILLTGATGYVGSVVAERLQEHGHELVVLVRDGRRSRDLPAGADPVVGDLADPSGLRQTLPPVDGVVHLASATPADKELVDVLSGTVEGPDGPLVWTSGVWVLGATTGTVADELSPTRPIELVAQRPEVESAVAARRDVRPVVLRPGIVHGRGGGIPRLLVDMAREHGTGRVVGDGSARWPMVHLDDLADLYVAALERAAPGAVLHGVAEAGVPAADLARAAATVAGAPPEVEPWPTADAATTLGAAFAEALALDQAVSATRTRFALGWHPRRVGALTDIAAGSYSDALVA